MVEVYHEVMVTAELSLEKTELEWEKVELEWEKGEFG
jgi:hypothetical protein